MSHRRHAARSGAAALLVVMGGVITACGSDEEPSSEPAATATTVPADLEVTEGDEVEVKAADNRFLPGDIAVRPGTEVRFVNVGRNVHDVLPADDADYEVPSEEFEPGDEATVTFDEPGTYRYYCSIHGTSEVGMIGTVYVVE